MTYVVCREDELSPPPHILQCLALRRNGESYGRIAAKFGKSPSTISRWLDNWKDYESEVIDVQAGEYNLQANEVKNTLQTEVNAAKKVIQGTIRDAAKTYKLMVAGQIGDDKLRYSASKDVLSSEKILKLERNQQVVNLNVRTPTEAAEKCISLIPMLSQLLQAQGGQPAIEADCEVENPEGGVGTPPAEGEEV